MAFPDNIKYLIMLYCLLNERLRITLQSLFSIPELLKFVEVLVQDVHLRRAHPRHPLTARKHHSGRLKPSLRAPTWATDTHFDPLLSCSLTYWRLSCHILLETWTPAGWSSTGCSPMGADQDHSTSGASSRHEHSAPREPTNYSASLSTVHYQNVWDIIQKSNWN